MKQYKVDNIVNFVYYGKTRIVVQWWGHSEVVETRNHCLLWSNSFENFALTDDWNAKTSLLCPLVPLDPLVPKNHFEKLSQHFIL